MEKRVCVLSHNGLGDGIVSLTLSHQLHLNGYRVDTIHNGLELLSSWFPHLSLSPYPSREKLTSFLETYERFFVFYNDSNLFTLDLIKEGKKRFPERVFVIYAYPSKNIVREKYYSDSQFLPHLSMVENILRFCRLLGLKNIEKTNGITPPKHLISRSHPNRVVCHVSSSRPGKNWPIHKYVKLALHLQKKGFSTQFIAGSEKEREELKWVEEKGIELPQFSSLDEVAQFLFTSAYLIGNDSGLGHLASSMGVPTITISRRKTVARLWRPDFTKGEIVVPYSFIPNIQGCRIRDRHWKKLISVRRVIKIFNSLQTSS